MKCPNPLIVSTLVLCLFAVACSKSGAKPSPPVVPPPDTTVSVGTMNINLLLYAGSSQAELIIAEPGGKVLLDTLATANAAVVATLKTNDSLLDVTQVLKYGTQNFQVTAYKSINPSRLTTLNYTAYQIYNVRTGATTKNTIFYDNIPAGILSYGLNSNCFFTNYPNNEFDGIESDPAYGSMEVTYQKYADNYAYLLFPSVGLYSLHLQVNALDTVDCSHLDSATLLSFNRSTPFTVVNGSTFIAIPDTTDLTKLISFTDDVEVYNKPGVDFEYANIPVQKYELSIYAGYPNNDDLYYYGYTGTIPNTLPFPQESDYVLSASQTDDLSVTFPNAKPTFYSAYLADSTIGYTLYESPDSGTVHPVTFLTNQKSKLLAGVNLNSLALSEFTFTYFDGLNYPSYLPFLTNAAAVAAHHPASVSSLTKIFP